MRYKNTPWENEHSVRAINYFRFFSHRIFSLLGVKKAMHRRISFKHRSIILAAIFSLAFPIKSSALTIRSGVFTTNSGQTIANENTCPSQILGDDNVIVCIIVEGELSENGLRTIEQTVFRLNRPSLFPTESPTRIIVDYTNPSSNSQFSLFNSVDSEESEACENMFSSFLISCREDDTESYLSRITVFDGSNLSDDLFTPVFSAASSTGNVFFGNTSLVDGNSLPINFFSNLSSSIFNSGER